MKAVIQDGKIFNFVDDSYIAGNKGIDNGTHPLISIKQINGFSPDVDMEEVAKNATREKGVFKYYLDDEGIVQMLDITTQPEYIEYQKQQRAEAYKVESDPLFFKVQRGEITNQEWLDKVQEIKNRFSY